MNPSSFLNGRSSLTVDVLDDSTGKGSFSCKGMVFIQGETVGAADMSGTFDTHK